jgi:hypothetical protein
VKLHVANMPLLARARAQQAQEARALAVLFQPRALAPSEEAERPAAEALPIRATKRRARRGGGP